MEIASPPLMVRSLLPFSRSGGASLALRRKHAARDAIQRTLDSADSYAQWAQAAQAYDALTGRARWKQHARSACTTTR